MLLDGLTVLEVGTGVAGSSACAVLASLGAEVSKICDIEDDSDSFSEFTYEREIVRLRRGLLDRGKTLLDIANWDKQSIVAFDIVVVDRIEGFPALLPQVAAEYLEYVALHNQSSWTTISAYGMSGMRNDWVGSDLTLSAAGGTLSSVVDPTSKRPIKLAGLQSLLSAGQVAALAALHALDVSRGRDRGVHVDVSAQESVIATGPALQCLQVLFGNHGPSGAKRNGSPAGNFYCRDGVIRISAMEQHQWQGVVRAMGSPTWAENFDTTALRVEHAKTIDERVNEWCAKLSKTECEQVLQQHGVPATALNEPKELLDSPQFKARKCLERVDIDGKKVVAIDLPFKFLEGSRNGAVAKKDERRITRLRIAEASHVLAMPLAGSILGAMGANVTKLEDPRRLDMYRRRGPYIDDLEGVDRNVFFPGVNHSKRSFVVDMDKDLDTLREILDNSDVLIENLGTERGSRVGLDYLHLNETRPELFSLSSTGFGMTGPWSKYRAYAYNVLTSSGLGYLTQTPSGKPADIDMAWADLQTGFALATLVTAWAVGPHRSVGASIDFSMVELVSSRANEYLAAASEGFETKPEHGENHEFPNAPNSLYATTGGSQWITITVRSDEQWNSLKEALGVPTSLEAKEFSSKVLRQKNQQLLDSAMQLLISDLDGAGLSASLQALGVPASLMLVPDELVADPYLSQEKFFGKVEHPQWGEHCLLGLPWRFFGEPRFPLGSPPELGNANDGG